MKQTDPQFKLRLPPALKQRLEDAATEGGKTLTAEIVRRLEASFSEVVPATEREVHDLLAQFDRMLDDKLRRFHVIDDGHSVRVVHTGDVAADGDDEEVGRLKEILARDDGVSSLPELKLEPTPTKGLPGRGRPR